MSDSTFVKAKSSRVKTLSDFENINVKEGVFVRIVGENDSFFNDFQNLERNLCRAVANGSIAYKRVSILPKLVLTEDIDYYSECYNNWIRSCKKKAVVKATENNAELSILLANGVSECLNLLQKTRSQMTQAMEKNFIVKLLFWFDSVAVSLVSQIGFRNCVKIIGENVVKLQEYLFFYLMALTDFNVLLLENKCDIDSDAKRLDLSAGIVLGHLGTTQLPPYMESVSVNNSIANANTNSQQSGNVRVTIPPRPNRARSGGLQNTPTHTQQSGNIRMTIPPRPNTQRNPPQNITAQSQQGGNIRMTIPPRQNNPTQQYPQRGASPSPSVPPAHGRGVRITTPTVQGISVNAPQNGTRINTQPRVEKSYEELAQLASSIVLIYILRKKPFGKEEGEVVGTGSGIMIGESGYILTNCHVARAGTAYGVRLENEEKIYFTDELIKYHSDLDLAIIRIDRRLRPLKIYNGTQGLVRGQRVVAIGSPLGLFNTVSDGIISGFRNVDGVDMIQFTAPISSGSSGGAVLNMYGEVIGISTAGIDDGQNINLAVGYETINRFIGNFT